MSECISLVPGLGLTKFPWKVRATKTDPAEYWNYIYLREFQNKEAAGPDWGGEGDKKEIFESSVAAVTNERGSILQAIFTLSFLLCYVSLSYHYHHLLYL